MRTYIQRRAARLGIEFIDRFNAETLEKILAVRENLLLLKFSRQPKVLVIYNKDDDSDAFVNNGFRQLFESGFDVVYFEAADVADINWLEAEITSANLERAFSILQLGGHGTLQDIQFGKLSGFNPRQRYRSR
ncbi:hypothetical protein HZC34_08140 [Candidatus Saganbacteria bacterium]|nr:hypothetical protein [Candidatus Saganbacteria bacterium]